jgi:hypothetical protein
MSEAAVDVADVVVLPKKSCAIDCPVCPGMRIGSSLASWLYRHVSLMSSEPCRAVADDPALADTSVLVGLTTPGWAAAEGGATVGAAADVEMVGEEIAGGEVVVLPPEVSARLAAVPPTTTRATSALAPINAPSRLRVKTLFENAFMMDPSLCPDQSVDSKCQWTISHVLRNREGDGIARPGSSS